MATVLASALAPAKLNLGLDIIGRRPDGYHQLCTIMQSVTLFDRLDLLYPGNGRLLAGNEQSHFENNVVDQAAGRLSERLSRPLDVDFRLTKRIPSAAGLGGGSSDAAAAILLLARHWSIPPSHPLLLEVALETGSDVPFFLGHGRALVEGQGRSFALCPRSTPSGS
jgi:4-diphosphocytidyl-2-C-methyl-D-erythritol kinase